MYLKILSWYEIPSYRMQEISLVTLDNREKTPPKAFDEYLGAPDGGAKAWSVVLG